MLARLGAEARDPLDEFLALYEAKKIHKLDGNSFELTKNAPAGVIVLRFAE
mgnify:CR=1 FL=1